MPRRIAALVVLLALAFTRAAAAACPMRVAGRAHHSPGAAAATMHHPQHPAPPSSRRDAGRDCAGAAACALVADVSIPPACRSCVIPAAPIAARADRYASPVLPSDPPPPRPALLA